MAKAQEYRDMTAEELEAQVLDSSKQLFTIRNEQKLTKKFDQPHELRNLKKDIARMHTVLNEKKRSAKAEA